MRWQLRGHMHQIAQGSDLRFPSLLLVHNLLYERPELAIGQVHPLTVRINKSVPGQLSRHLIGVQNNRWKPGIELRLRHAPPHRHIGSEGQRLENGQLFTHDDDETF